MNRAPVLYPLIDRHSSPALLARVASAPEPVCALIFEAAGGEARLVRLIRSSCIVPRWCRARQAIVKVAVDHLDASSHQIARALNRDHSTVLYSYRIAQSLVKRDPEFRQMCDKLVATIDRQEAQ